MSKIEARLHWNHVYRTTNYSKNVTNRSATILDRATDFFGDLRGKRLLEIGCGGGAQGRRMAFVYNLFMIVIIFLGRSVRPT
jgi:cyclopropane fatty-acyl-phospholipid synthase-like methyltransferase